MKEMYDTVSADSVYNNSVTVTSML